MTVLRAALLFDHPTTRLFASRILESFFCPPRSSPSSPPPPSRRPHPPALRASSSARLVSSSEFPRLALRGARPPFVLFCYGSSVPFTTPRRILTPSFCASHLLSGSSVNKRTRAKEESKAFCPPPRLLALHSSPPSNFPFSSFTTTTTSSSFSFLSSS